LQAISKAISGLRAVPCRYRRGAAAGTRELTVERHVVIYQVVPDTNDNVTAGDVEVLRVFGPGQQRQP
jgi:hypothetical protein